MSISIAAAGTYYVDNAMLVVGSQPADYAPLHPADDLARCLRYYEIIGDKRPVRPISAGYYDGSRTSLHVHVHFQGWERLYARP